MDTSPIEFTGTPAEIAQYLASFPNQRLHVAVRPARESDPTTPRLGFPKDDRDIMEVLHEIAASVPASELAKLPADFCDQLDHYIYGTPKQ